MNRFLSAIVALIFVSGCTTSPDVYLGYRLPKSDALVQVQQDIICEKDSSGNYSYTTENKVSFVTNFGTDDSKTFYVNPKHLGNWWADSKLTMTYTDGRLASIKPSTSGQGSALVSAALDIIGLAKSKDRSDETLSASPKEDACKEIVSKVKGDIKKVSVVQTAKTTDFSSPNKTFTARVLNKKIKFEDIKVLVDAPSLSVSQPNRPDPMHLYESACVIGDSQYAKCLAKSREIVAVEPALYTFTITVGNQTKSQVIKAPQEGKMYTLPLPKSALFATTDADIQFNPDGTVKTITYNAKNNFEDVSKAAQSIRDEIKGDDELTETQAELSLTKAQADLILQQQRLEKCQTAPSDCA